MVPNPAGDLGFFKIHYVPSARGGPGSSWGRSRSIETANEYNLLTVSISISGPDRHTCSLDRAHSLARLPLHGRQAARAPINGVARYHYGGHDVWHLRCRAGRLKPWLQCLSDRTQLRHRHCRLEGGGASPEVVRVLGFSQLKMELGL